MLWRGAVTFCQWQGIMRCDIYWRNCCIWIWLIVLKASGGRRALNFPRQITILADCITCSAVLSPFASDRILFAATFFCKYFAFEFDWLRPSESGGLDFPRQCSILADCEVIYRDFNIHVALWCPKLDKELSLRCAGLKFELWIACWVKICL